MERIWEDVVHRNMYVTGGIGSAGDNEGFSVDYDLPNEEAYCETCASVGMVFWNQRMGSLTGNSKYYDVLERSLYNGALDGISLSGDLFFYDNPLASNGRHTRKAWFGTACCPANIARLVASLGNYVYGQSNDAIWVNLYVGSDAKLMVKGKEIAVKMETNYPWDGKMRMQLNLPRKEKFAVKFRIPGWYDGNLVDGNLYTKANAAQSKILTAFVNGKPVSGKMEQGYLLIENNWTNGDVVELEIPMETQLVQSRPEVKANTDRLAIQRGPLVYCVEGADNPKGIWNLMMDPSANWTGTPMNILAEKVIALEATIREVVPAADGMGVVLQPRKVTAIPYYVWANRQANDMQVWLPTRIHSVMINNEYKKSDGGND
ncbi:MAG: glycoside hydrolase family 127 protein [Chitinophagaceae bacterium]|nr:glycoside hydrolase family 127 protein [Chitinophagaceae bacterium]